jgi:glutathione S-transferase
MGDIPVGALTYRWYALPIEHPELPHLVAWYERLTARPAFREHAMIPLS